MNEQHQQYAMSTTPTHAIIAAEGSDLAHSLSSGGWVARSGWRSLQPGRPSVWLVRFERSSSASQ